MTVPIKHLSPALIFSLLCLSGCGGGSSSGTEVFVRYSLDPMICDNASSVIPSGSTPAGLVCSWYCATYQGKKKQFVSLGFLEQYGFWVLLTKRHQNATDAQCNFSG